MKSGIYQQKADSPLRVRNRAGGFISRHVLGAVAVLLLGGHGLPAQTQPANAFEQAESRLDLLQFLDGSTLHGRLVRMEGGGAVRWETPDAKRPIDFLPTNIERIWFESHEAPPGQSKSSCRFRFKNGDEIYGDLVSLDSESVELDAAFGGTLNAARTELESIAISSNGFFTVYEGPTGLHGWKVGSTPRGWQYREGAFVASSNGIIGRDFKLTESAMLEFDLSWTGHFSLVVTLYTDRLDRFTYNHNAYGFFIGAGYVNAQRIQATGPMSLGQAQLPEMRRKNKTRFQMFVNKQEATVTLFADGALVQQWKDNAGFHATGTGIAFFAQHEGPTIKVSNIKVSEWDGKFGTEKESIQSPDDELVLVNGDSVRGTLRRIQDGKLSLATGAGATLEIPLARVTQISFKESGASHAPRSPWLVRSQLSTGDAVTFELNAWNEREISGSSRNFGRLALDPRVIRQMHFNVDRPAEQRKDGRTPDEQFWHFHE